MDANSTPARPLSLLVFEPASLRKWDCTLDALKEINEIQTIGVASRMLSEKDLREHAESRIPKDLVPRKQLEVIQLLKGGLASDVANQVAARGIEWDGLTTPFEMAVEEAAAVAKELRPRPRFHDTDAAAVGRNKDRFREYFTSRFERHDFIRMPRFSQIPFQAEAPLLIEAIRKAVHGWSPVHAPFDKVVLKPLNGGGSAAVRRVQLSASQLSTEVDIFIQSFRTLNSNGPLDGVNDSMILVEEWVQGEEFSVESRIRRRAVEAITVHWKPDIDAELPKFFERIFVTLPPQLAPYALLVQGNADLLHALGELGLEDGVFHAEFRVDVDRETVVPLEVGLRPGGGMVTKSVRAARGVDLYREAAYAALDLPGARPMSQETVATSHLYSLEVGSFRGFELAKSGQKAICHTVSPDELNHMIRGLRREEIRDKYLLPALYPAGAGKSPNGLTTRVLQSFDESQGTLHAEVRDFESFMIPGNRIVHPECDNVAGLLAVATEPNAHSAIANVAEVVAAVAVCTASMGPRAGG